MTRFGRALVFAGVSCAMIIGPTATAFAVTPTEIDLSGPVAGDQTPATSSLVVDTVTAPAPTSVNGGSTSSLTTDVLSPYYTDSPTDLQVYTSTGTGTSAITGVVTDASGVVAGATVTISPSAGGQATTAASDANGGFAFVNIPVASSGTAYDLTVNAAGDGSYSVTSDTYLPDTTYETTVSLTSSAQSYDASATVTQGTQDATDSGSLAPYTSWHRPPPTIKVAVYTLTGACRPSGSPTIKTYPFNFYVQHVAAPEISTGWPKTPTRANMLAESNYAWWFIRHPPSSSYNVDNTTNFQCFEPWLKVPTSWGGWVDGVLTSALQLNGDVQETFYKAGNRECTDPAFPQNGNQLSQLGSLWLNEHCGYSYYKDIDNYYYTGTFVDNTIPPVPNTSYSRPSGGVKLNFPSQIGDSNGHVSNVGWSYTVDYYDTNLPTPHWITIYNRGWSWSSRSIPTSFTYNTGSCHQYRVSATSPAGTSQFASFNGGNAICPG